MDASRGPLATRGEGNKRGERRGGEVGSGGPWAVTVREADAVGTWMGGERAEALGNGRRWMGGGGFD